MLHVLTVAVRVQVMQRRHHVLKYEAALVVRTAGADNDIHNSQAQ
jgi:hypothetical protein